VAPFFGLKAPFSSAKWRIRRKENVPRANRYHVPGYIWHITERCHRRHFLLKFARDRRAWIAWLGESRRRYGLCVLDYTATSNHVHLLVRDQGRDEIPASMQLIAGRTGQGYNARKKRKGAFWEDRYHATAVDTDEHLARCVVYIDLNMVRAGVVDHPAQWDSGGYHEIQAARQRGRIIDREALAELLGLEDVGRLAGVHREWIETALVERRLAREAVWTESLAVGRREFVERVAEDLGVRARYRQVQGSTGLHVLRDPGARYVRVFGAETRDFSDENGPD
jgi:putative transposase